MKFMEISVAGLVEKASWKSLCRVFVETRGVFRG